jgi:hypothetical protein
VAQARVPKMKIIPEQYTTTPTIFDPSATECKRSVLNQFPDKVLVSQTPYRLAGLAGPRPATDLSDEELYKEIWNKMF